MEKSQNDSSVVERASEVMQSSASRRNFIRTAGLTTAVGVAIFTVGCKDDDPIVSTDGTVNLGANDTGILNYAYALEQLEAAFYTQVLTTPYAGMSAAETAVLTDIRDHEIIHRDFFKTALGANAIPGLEVNFSTIDFTSRDKVLGAAKLFEDTGVAAYNGAGKLLKDVNNLLLAGKIVSVEGRHAAAIADLMKPNTAFFAGDEIIDANGLDAAKMPSEILTAVQPFVKTKINGSNLPTA
jgi:Ferritin-like domain